ncbi:hypothetical protein KIW84_040946 [Lathyrus oleraceus]|uniref:Uncharacterized protein n=1 Tax=Pisum sativum TaxID=3888 RepID=A0A9D4X6X9_PEA|nr:hypothetical protein KIW84_040946 [Pisum sativum]
MHDDGESSDEDIPDEDVAKAFKQLYLTWKEECMTKLVLMLNRGSETVHEVLEVGKSVRGVKEIGFDYNFHNTKHKFVPPINRLS